MEGSSSFGLGSQSIDTSSRIGILKMLQKELKAIENQSDHYPEKMMSRVSLLMQNADFVFAQGNAAEKASNPEESVLDSNLMRGTSDAIVRCSANIARNINTYDMNQLAQHINANNEYWTFAFPYEAPIVSFLFGTFQPIDPQRQSIARNTQSHRQKMGAPVVPRLLDRTTEPVQQEKPNVQAERIYKILKRECENGPIEYFNVVLDPTSFSRTVENIFNLSFLSNDHKISVLKDSVSGLPVVNTISTKKRSKSENARLNQFVLSIDKNRWQELITAFQITERFLRI